MAKFLLIQFWSSDRYFKENLPKFTSLHILVFLNIKKFYFFSITCINPFHTIGLFLYPLKTSASLKRPVGMKETSGMKVSLAAGSIIISNFLRISRKLFSRSSSDIFLWIPDYSKLFLLLYIVQSLPVTFLELW